MTTLIANEFRKLRTIRGPLLLLAAGGEYRHKTITDPYLATPRRGRVIAAKFAVYAAVGAVFGLMLAITAVIATAVAITANSGSLDLSNSDLWRTLAGGVACNAAFAALGVSLGALIRPKGPPRPRPEGPAGLWPAQRAGGWAGPPESGRWPRRPVSPRRRPWR